MLANTKISIKIYGLAAMLLVILIGAASTGIYQMNKIGVEIADVAEVDISITENITKITIHQLEQAVLFERGLAVGQRISSHPEALAHFQDIVKKFIDLGHKVEKEMKEAEEQLAEEIEVAHTPEMKSKFEHLLSLLKKADAEHAEYEHLGEDALKKLGAGELSNFEETAGKIEHLEDQIVHELEAALEEIETFTANAILTAEEHEKSAIKLMIAITIGALIAGIGVSFQLGRSITTPIVDMTESMDALANGNLDADIPGVGRGDEIGVMAGSVQVFKDNAIERVRLEAEQEKMKQRAEQERQAMMVKMADSFQEAVGNVIQSVSSAATELQASAETMANTAEQTSTQVGNVASSSDQSAANVQTVASAAEELSSSINEIARQVSTALSANEDAVSKARNSEQTVQKLVESAQKIGDVVELISDVAEQTNLLALNATIEAARAGEAGKGFAVVASEVKNLANQTAKATEDIREQVSNIRDVAEDAATSINDISTSISVVSENTTGISAAIEEQDAATQEIARNVEQAAAGTQDVASNVNLVTQGASETGSAASDILEAAQELSQQSEFLTKEVGKFLAEIRGGQQAA